MAQIFGPTSNIYSKLSILAAVLLSTTGRRATAPAGGSREPVAEG